jgi:hypothetical protein
VDLIASRKGPIDIVQTPSASIDPQQCARSFGFIQSQRLFGGLDERLKGRSQAGSAFKQPVDHHLAIAGGQHATQLSSTPIARPGKVAFRRQSCLFATRQTGEIHIQNLVVLEVVMPIALAVVLIDLIHRLLHLMDGVRSTGGERLLDY